MKQFWDIKSTMFDKIIFFKLGKFYEMFYMDAIICQKIFDLGWTNEPKKLHVGFPEKSLDKNIETLINTLFTNFDKLNIFDCLIPIYTASVPILKLVLLNNHSKSTQ